jgi:hypothetical protein
VADLPRIAKAVADAGIEVRWLLIGSGPEEAALKAGFADLVAQGQAEFAGRLGNEETLARFQECDALILTSAFEGLPVAMLEGMGHGLVPIVTRIESGVDDLVRDGENGLTVPVGDIDGFVAAIGRVCDAEFRASLRRAAFDTIAEGPYSIDHAVREYLRIFEAAAAARDEGSFKRPKPVRPRAWTGNYIVPPELQIAPDAYYDLKWLSEWQAERIRTLEAQLNQRPVAPGTDLSPNYWRRVWSSFASRPTVAQLLDRFRSSGQQGR